MKYFITILAILLSMVVTQAAALTPLSIQSRFSFEYGSNWEPVDTTKLQSATQGGLITSWTLNPSTATNFFKFSTTRPYNLPRNYTIPGTITNASDTGTRDLAVVVEVAASEKNIQANLSSSQGKLVGGFAFENNYTTVDFVPFDFFKLHNGVADAVIQFMSYSPLRYRAHTGSPSFQDDASAVNVSAAQTNVWITFKFDNTPGVTNFSFSVYDLDTRSILGTGKIALNGASYPNVADIRISNDSHGLSTVSRTNYVDNFMLSTNLSDYPMLPWDTNKFYVNGSIGSDSNSGKDNTAAAAWATIGKAASTITAGQTAYVAAGTYNEQVNISSSGSSGNPRTFIGGTNVILRRFNITGSYIKIVGFEFTHPTDINVPPLTVNGGDSVEIIDCFAHDTAGDGNGSGIVYGSGTDDLLIRGNAFLRTGFGSVEGGGTTAGKAIGATGTGVGANRVLIEYNTIASAFEYINPTGDPIIIRNNVGGPTLQSDFPALDPHIDFVQANSQNNSIVLEANAMLENSLTNAHFFLTQNRSTNAVLVGNIGIRIGDALLVEYSNGNGFHMANNIFAQLGSARGIQSWHAVVFNQSPYTLSIGPLVCRNNIFTNCTTSSDGIYVADVTQNFTHDHDIDDRVRSTSTRATFKSYNSNYGGYPTGFDLRPLSSSSAQVDSGGALTTTVGSGTGTTITVGDSAWFYGLYGGQLIYVGSNNNIRVTAVDVANKQVTVASSISWNNGDNVGYAYRGSAPDIGAYEDGDTLLTGGTISTNSGVVTVTPTGDARMVVFYIDGVPQAPIYDSPYTYTIVGNETVSAKIYSRRAQETMVFAAAGTGGGSDVTNPTITITSPTSSSTYDNGSTSTIDLGGTASDDVSVSSVTWSNDQGGSGTATGTTSWSISGITLSSGSNVITVTATDSSGNTGTDTITVTYTPSTPSTGNGRRLNIILESLNL